MVQPCTWVQTRRIRANTQCCLSFHRGGRPRAGASWPPPRQTLNIMREAVIAEVSDSTIRGSWRHRAPSRTDVAGRTFVRLRSDGGLGPHSDIDLLVTVTVRLDETTRRALINDLLETSASPGRERDSPRCRSHHCCARRHHSVALSS